MITSIKTHDSGRVWWVAQAYNPSYTGGLQVEASLDKKFARPRLNQLLSVVRDVCHPSYSGKHK
jgi:hypothetical protein